MPSLRATPDSLRADLAASSSPPTLEPGDTLADRYRLDREVGRTEAGIVFDAVDAMLNRRVAVEVASSIEEPKARRKWARDAMLAQRLEGEHVLRVLDVGNAAGGVPYAVREAALCTMAAEIEVKGALPIALAVAWTLETCEAIAEAHALGMAHGDLRLDNIYLVRGATEPSVKVAWTSAAKAERAAKEDVARDLAGLGAMLRVLSTGRMSDDESDGAPTLPSDLAHAVARALSIDPRDRIQNVAELARMLAPYAPPGHPSARNVVFLLSRAGIVGGTLPTKPPTSRRQSAIVPVAPVLPVVAAPSAPSTPSTPTDFTDEWFGHAPRAPLGGTLAPARHRARPAFALVSVALIGLVLGGSWLLWQNGKLPRWTGTAPPDGVGKTEVTGAPATAAEPTTAEPATATAAATATATAPAAPMRAQPATTSVESLPSAPVTTAAHADVPPVATSTTPTTKRAQADERSTTTPPLGGGDLRYVDPPAATTTATPTPAGDSTSAPSLGSPSPPTTSPEPVPTQPQQPVQGPSF
jgi:hypothetical protein